MPPASAHVGVLDCDSAPLPIDLMHHTGADADTHALINVAVYLKPRMHHRDVWREKAHMHLGRGPGTQSKRPVGPVQTLHQI